LNRHAPLRKKSKNEQKLKAKQWLTKAIIKSSKTKNRLYASSLRGDSNDLQIYKRFWNKRTNVKE